MCKMLPLSYCKCAEVKSGCKIMAILEKMSYGACWWQLVLPWQSGLPSWQRGHSKMLKLLRDTSRRCSAHPCCADLTLPAQNLDMERSPSCLVTLSKQVICNLLQKATPTSSGMQPPPAIVDTLSSQAMPVHYAHSNAQRSSRNANNYGVS